MSNRRLLETEHRLVTEMGKAFLCDRVVMRGKDLHHDLGNMDWFRVYLFSITGREFTDHQIKLLNFFWVATSYPDPSIWPNHVAELAGSVRSTASLSIMAGMSISEASIYGRRPERRAIDFFYRAKRLLDQGLPLPDIIESELSVRKTLYGYGRPLAKIDERVPHTLKLVEDLNLDEGPHLKIALAVYDYLKKSRGLSMNIAAIDAALAADIGLSPEEYQLFMSPCFIAGMVPCYLDGMRIPEGGFFPVRCESIQYSGPDVRVWD